LYHDRLRIEPEALSNPLSLHTVDQDATAVLLAKAAVLQAMPPADAADTYETRKAHADKVSLDFVCHFCHSHSVNFRSAEL
jgi:cytochrome c5